MTFTKKVSDLISTLVLGSTKELIVRMDEKLNMLNHLDRRMSVIESDLKDVRERLPVVEQSVSHLQKSMDKLEYRFDQFASRFKTI